MAINSNQWISFVVAIINLNIIIINSAPSDSTASDVTVSRYFEYTDKDVDPCNNFYKFACGNFIKTAVIPNQRRTLKAKKRVENKIEEQLIDIMKKPSSSSELKPLKSIKQFYTRCLDQNSIDELGLEPMLQLFDRLGGWPVIKQDQWNDQTWSWNDFTRRCRDNGITESLFIDLTLRPNPIDSTKLIITVRPLEMLTSSLAQLIESIDEEKEYDADRKYMVDVVNLVLGDTIKDFDEKIIENEMIEVLKFTQDLSKIIEMLNYNESIYNLMTIKNMIMMWPSVQWLDYFQKLLPPNVQIDDNEIINVIHPEYLTEFEKLIEKTSKRVQANFGIWNAFLTIIDTLPTQVQELREEHYKYLGINYSKVPRDEYCFKISNSFFSIGINALYVREYFDQEDKKSVAEILTNIKTQLHNRLDKIEWMDDETKKNSLKKVDAITGTIAFPDELLNDEMLENFYSYLKVDCDNFLNCYLNTFAATVGQMLVNLKQPIDENSWINNMFILDNDISYSPNDNEITIPAAILQDVFYGKERPKYTNYAVLGSFIAEKLLNISHSRGQFYDNEDLNELWTKSTRKQFGARAKCLVHQYNNYSVDGMMLNGVKNLYSNIERHEGIKLAYDSYNNWMIENDIEPRLPGFDSTFTPKKLFWISFANANCARMNPNYLKRFIEIGNSIPPEFEINGALSDIPEFAEDFKCPTGSPMTRTDICSAW